MRRFSHQITKCTLRMSWASGTFPAAARQCHAAVNSPGVSARPSRRIRPQEADEEFDMFLASTGSARDSVAAGEDAERVGLFNDYVEDEGAPYNPQFSSHNSSHSVSKVLDAESTSTATAGDSSEIRGSVEATDETPQLSTLDTERQSQLYEAAIEDVVSYVVNYLNSTRSPQLVSATTEHVLFPVLFDRLQELSVNQMLDIVECHWARSTLVRYGVTYKDVARDRIAQLATIAAQQLRKNATSSAPSQAVSASATDDEGNGWGEAGGVYASDTKSEEAAQTDNASEENRFNPIITRAMEEINAETSLRAILVMGISAGHRKRDLEFFRLMGSFFAYHINKYSDPNDLVRTLTALNRAKIRPSQKFLEMVVRRMPVLCKKKPLEPLPSYRFMVNLSRMGCEQMSIYRFLSDNIFGQLEEKINTVRREEKLLKAKNRRRCQAGVTHNGGDHTADGERGEKKEGVANRPDAGAPPANVGALFSESATEAERAKARLQYMTGMKPSMFTKWLAVLARLGAPHQQYLRPLVPDVILPALAHLPPPSFTRLVQAVSRFRSTDAELIEALVRHLCEQRAPSSTVERVDLVTLLQIVSRDDVPIPDNMDVFVTVLCAVCEAGLTLSNLDSSSSGAEHPSPSFLMRPADMQRVAQCLVQLQRRPEMPLEKLEPLERLMDRFAQRLALLMEHAVVALPHVDAFLDTMARQQHPDRDGRVAALAAARQTIAQDEEAYEARLDIDVRETFYALLAMNDAVSASRYRPAPGSLQVDFRQALTRVSAFDVLEAVDIFDTVSPGALTDTPKRFLGRAVIAKLGGTGGEEVVNEATNTLELRKPRELLLRREDVARMLELLGRTPLGDVRRSPVVWEFLLHKAGNLGDAALQEAVRQQQQQHQQQQHPAHQNDNVRQAGAEVEA